MTDATVVASLIVKLKEELRQLDIDLARLVCDRNIGLPLIRDIEERRTRIEQQIKRLERPL